MNKWMSPSLLISALFTLSLTASAKEGDGECNCPNHQGPGHESVADSGERVSIELGSSVIKGANAAPVTVVIFSDFECPFCKKATDRIADLEAANHGNVRFVFKHRPLPFHESARLYARAAEAASAQGKFWAMHDKLFSAEKHPDRAALDAYAAELGLDLNRFKKDLESKEIEARIKADEAQADRLDVKGTPTFFINGRRVTGAQPTATLQAVIDEELHKK
ncbi:MAG: thioredoxin domain-containing protein [Myxococcota bacterium]